MAEADKRPVTMEELLVSSLAQTDALAKLLIEKGLITRDEFMQKIAKERAMYQNLLNPDATIFLVRRNASGDRPERYPARIISLSAINPI